ncbi:perforin-1-like [Poecilia formosa]|uniref:perforin-1-like n=1 Tax=Poecilia formosa TaxID=48698 RepID=UPI0007B858A6|nr:PREDICTED: perforin-1-like [Poecilia formosa]
MNGLTSSQVHNCLSMGVAVGLGKMKLSSIPHSCNVVLKNKDFATGYYSEVHHHFTEVSGGNSWLGEFLTFENDSMGFMNWLKSLKEHPDVVSYSLRPLYELIPSKQQQEEMKAAIEHYLEDNALWNLPEEPHCDDVTPNVASNCCPLHVSRGILSVTIVRAWSLYGDDLGPADSYAKMYYGSIQRRTKMLDHSNPRWNTEFRLGMVDTSLALKIEVWDEDPKYDDLLVQCVKYLSPGTHTFTCTGLYGNVMAKYTLTCEPYLTGEKCRRYKPSPLETEDW